MQQAVIGVEKSGIQQPAHTVSGRLEQARRWLAHPDRDDRGLGQQAIALIVAEGKKVSCQQCPAEHRTLALKANRFFPVPMPVRAILLFHYVYVR